MPKPYRFLILILLLLAACSSESAPSATPTPAPTPTLIPTPIPDSLYVDAGVISGTISSAVYGTNYGPWISVPYDLLTAYQESGLRYLRFPGGHWGDLNNITEMHLDRFIKLADMIDAEVSVSVRLLEGTPEQAAALVEYANVTQGYDIRHWSIGNEPSLFATMDDAEEYDTAFFNARWREFAEAMLAVDPDIVLLGPEVHQFTADLAANPTDAAGRDWMREFLLANGDLVGMVTFHRYPFPKGLNDAPPSVDELLHSAAEWDRIIPALRALIQETTGRDIPIGVTEVNSNWSGAFGSETSPDGFYNAIWWADALGRLIRQQVDVVAHFALQSSPNMGGWGLLERYEVRPTYYVYQLYQRFGSTLVRATSGHPDLSIYAALRDDGALTLIVINLSGETQRYPLRLSANTPTGTAEAWRLAPDHNADPIDPQPITRNTQLTLPPYSATLYVVPTP